MSEPRWQERCAALAAAAAPPPRGGELAAWLQHQRGLHALGWLPPRRRRTLEALQVGWCGCGLLGGAVGDAGSGASWQRCGSPARGSCL
jgi:hypothetical protein